MSTSNSGPKRPYATLDLRATEIKVTPITTQATVANPSAIKPEDVPLPLPAKAYATASPQASGQAKTSPSAAQAAAAAKAPAPEKVTATISTSNMKKPGRPATMPEAVAVQKRGGFFSHLTAGLIGGALALGAYAYGLPELQKRGVLPALGLSSAPDFSDRIAKLEAGLKSDAASKLQAAEARIAALEKQTGLIGELKEAQSRLVAETKAALAASASDSGAPDQLERLGAVENKLKAIIDAGANNPNAGRVEQIAALTGKVSDLETSLATQLTVLRKAVSGDVEARVVAVNEAAEAAKSGMQRIDRDVASIKTEAAKIDERVAQLKAEVDKMAEQNKLRQQELASLKVDLDGAKSASAKPADVASAVAPVTKKIAELEKGLQTVAASEQTRQSNAERVVLALELQNLKRALDRGAKYDAELAEVEKAAGGKFDLAALAKFKQAGVPTLADLTRDFRSSASTIIDADAGVPTTTVVDRLLAGAKNVVRVRRTDYAPDDKSAEAIAGRIEKALKDGRLGDVLNEASLLSPKAKDAAQPFLEKVSARATVDRALASLEGQLKTSLSGAPAEPPSKTE
jgi:hypothetical protein